MKIIKMFGNTTGLPPSAKKIIYTALEKEPDHLYQTASEMAAALRRGAPRSAGAGKNKSR